MKINIQKILLSLMACLCLTSYSNNLPQTQDACFESKIQFNPSSLAEDTIAQQLGWVYTPSNRCHGYYLEEAFPYPSELAKQNLIQYTNTGPTLFSLRGTSILKGHIIVTQMGQQIKSKKAYLYRDPITRKIIAVNMFGDVRLREPNSLIVARKAFLNLRTHEQSLSDILYRTAIYANPNAKPISYSNEELQKERKVTQLTAWGTAKKFTKKVQKIFEFEKATYSTCPPTAKTWWLDASHIKLNKITGRGEAKNVKVFVKKIPVFYSPYLNFAIDDRRQTGFLHPFVGSDAKSGPYLGLPFYLNLAPNYDDTITPAYLSKRSLQINNLFRYLTPVNRGKLSLSIIPDDKAFNHFQTKAEREFSNSHSSTVQANLTRLQHAGQTRGAVEWIDNARFNEHWSTSVNYNGVSDDYYLQDFGHTLKETTENQLPQQAEINYEGKNWNFTGRVHQYQTLHPVDSQIPFQNQYIRLPQLILNGENTDQKSGLNYFISNEMTRFDIRKMPGSDIQYPIGNRYHMQPRISLPLNWPYLFVLPRIQLALSQYQLRKSTSMMPMNSTRTIPIFDLNAGLYFDRSIKFLGYSLTQTLEPQLYYLYVPYHNQNRFPIFDTTENTLTYSQLFSFNRFSGLDRFGDANQMSLGVTSRFLNSDTGDEKIDLGIGQILYLTHRNVTRCTVDNPNCLSPEELIENKSQRSPLTGVINYHLNPAWTLTSNLIWDTKKNEMNNQIINLQYNPQPKRFLNLGYNFVRRGDLQPNIPVNSPRNNLKQISASFAWPVYHDWTIVGQWTQSINQGRFQSYLYGLQYDSCCWAIRFVGGRNFVNNDLNGSPVYNTKVYMQFAFRGLGNVGSSDPTQLLSTSIGGYNPTFGQDF